MSVSGARRAAGDIRPPPVQSETREEGRRLPRVVDPGRWSGERGLDVRRGQERGPRGARGRRGTSAAARLERYEEHSEGAADAGEGVHGLA